MDNDEEIQNPEETPKEEAEAKNEPYNMSWIRIMLPEEEFTPPVQVWKLWWKTIHDRDRVVDHIKAKFLEMTSDVTFKVFDEEEGRKEAGWVVMSTHPPWEVFVAHGMQPVVTMNGCEN